MSSESKVPESKVPVLDLPYGERQFVMVIDDAIAEVLRLRRELEEAEAKTGAKSKDTEDWAALAAMVVGLAFPVTRVAFLGVAGYEAIRRGLEAWGQARESVDIRQVAASDASREITFPPGHPRPDVLYIGHPCVPHRYCTPSDFHRMVFEHKYSEALRLLMALGATAIEVHHVAGWTKEICGTMGSAFGFADAVNATGQAEASLEKREVRSLILKADLAGRARRQPHLPEDMVWYPHEQLWQAVARGRLDHQLSRCQLAVNYADDFGVNAELHSAIGVGKKGAARLNLGGHWNEYTTTVWRIDAVFGDDDADSDASLSHAAEGVDGSSALEA